MEKIEVRDLRKAFIQKGSQEGIIAIEHLTFDISKREIVSIVGQTGCGKSTFLNILLGVDRPTSGYIKIDGKTPYGDFNYFKGKIAGVFQQDRLLPWRTSLENAKIGLEILRYDEKEQIRIARGWLKRLGLQGFEDAYPSELSGGMRQRVALARALAFNPELVLFDEAFGHLDEVTASKLRKEFLDLSKSLRVTSVVVTHNLDEAIELGNRILVFGKPARLLADIQVDTEAKTDLNRFQELRRSIQEKIDRNK